MKGGFGHGVYGTEWRLEGYLLGKALWHMRIMSLLQKEAGDMGYRQIPDTRLHRMFNERDHGYPEVYSRTSEWLWKERAFPKRSEMGYSLPHNEKV